MQRRAVAPVMWVGSVMLAAFTVSVVNDAIGEPLGQLPKRLLLVALAALAVAVLVARAKVELGQQFDEPVIDRLSDSHEQVSGGRLKVSWFR